MASNSPPAAKADRFEQIFKRYYRPVNYYFARRGCSQEESSDLTQETFLGVYKGMGRYREEANIETWLFIIAGNIWRNWLRSQSAQKRDAAEISLDQSQDGPKEPIADTSQNDPLDRALEVEKQHMLGRELEELPPRMRYCLLLRIDQGLKYREIATIMDTSVETVKSQLFQARERLKERLGKYLFDL